MKKLLLTFLFPLTMLAQSPTLQNFNASHFIVDWTAAVTNVIKLRNNPTNYWLLSGVGVEPIPGIVLVTSDNFLAHTSIWDEGELHTFGNKSFTLTNGVNDLDLTGYAFFYMQGTNTNCVVNLSFQGVGAHVWLVNGSNSTFTIPTAPHHDYPSFNQQFRGGYWQPSEVGEAIHLLGTTNGMVELGRSSPNSLNLAIINPTDGYVPYRSNSTQFADSPFYMSGTNIATDAQIIFGPGITNSLYRSAKDLVYTNGGLGVLVSVYDGLGNRASHGLGSGGSGLLSSSIGTTFVTDELVTHSIRPNANDTYSLGTENNSSGRWLNYVGRTNTIVGFNSLASDYSWTRMYQTDTNSPFVIDQQTAGTAGYSRGFSFRTNGVEIASFTGSGGGGTYVARAGDTMTGALTLPNAIFTNNATTTVPLQINATNGTTTNLFEVNSGGTNDFNIDKTGSVLVKQGTAAKVALGGIGMTDTGLSWNIGAASIDIYGGGSAIHRIAYGAFKTAAGQPICWTSGDPTSTSADTYLYRDGAANTLALRNGTAAQKYSVYNTWANSGTDYERGVLDWQTTANSFRVGTEMGGTGTSRSLQFCEGGTNIFYLDGATGKLLWNTDNSRDVGASGANRPANIYVGTGITAGVYSGTGTDFRFVSSSVITAPTDGAVRIRNWGNTSIGKIQVGAIQDGFTKVLTSTTAADFLYVSVPNTNGIGGHVVYTVFATDGTDVQEISGDVKFAAVAKGTTVTATLADVQGPAAVTGGSTLTAALASNVTTNNSFALGITATTSLTTTNLILKWRLETPSTYTVNAIP